jgi:diaminopimelate decarboxylase
MAKKMLPFTKAEIEKIIETYPTPFHLYDERGIKENARGASSERGPQRRAHTPGRDSG